MPPLLLTMEETAYSSSSSILRVGCILHHGDEKYAVYSIARRRGGEEEKRSILPTPTLLFSSSQLSTRLTCLVIILVMEEVAYSGDRWQGGVGRLLHCEEERRHTIEYTAYFSSQWRRQPTHHPPSCAGEQGVRPVLNRNKIARWKIRKNTTPRILHLKEGLVAGGRAVTDSFKHM